jgi:hypothetical protein
MERLTVQLHVRELHARGVQGFALDHLYACSAVHSHLFVGLERAKMMGRSFRRLIASTTCRVNAPPFVLTPMRIVGLRFSIVWTRSLDRCAGWANGFCQLLRSGRDGSSRPLMSNIEMRP